MVAYLHGHWNRRKVTHGVRCSVPTTGNNDRRRSNFSLASAAFGWASKLPGGGLIGVTSGSRPLAGAPPVPSTRQTATCDNLVHKVTNAKILLWQCVITLPGPETFPRTA